MSSAEVIAYQARMASKWAEKNPLAVSGTPETDETGEFHGKIMEYLKSQGIRAIVHSRTDKKTTQERGIADFLCVFNGVPIALEAKTGKGKLSVEQKGWLLAAELDGWVVSVVRSLADVQDALEAAKARRL